MSYIGHGGIHLWADENLFDIGDVAGLPPQPRRPFLVTMNCLNGYFPFPYFDSLAEALLKAEGKGVIATFSPSGMSLDGPAHRFHGELLDAVHRKGHRRLGDAVLAAQSAYAASGALPELIAIYHLLGDPALSLRCRAGPGGSRLDPVRGAGRDPTPNVALTMEAFASRPGEESSPSGPASGILFPPKQIRN